MEPNRAMRDFFLVRLYTGARKLNALKKVEVQRKRATHQMLFSSTIIVLQPNGYEIVDTDVILCTIPFPYEHENSRWANDNVRCPYPSKHILGRSS
jgi:hypothetical protein